MSDNFISNTYFHAAQLVELYQVKKLEKNYARQGILEVVATIVIGLQDQEKVVIKW